MYTNEVQPFGPNHAPLLTGYSSSGSVPIAADPATGAMFVENITGEGIVPYPFNAIQYVNTSGTVDTYKYYQNGLSGTLVATITITYTDSTKSVLSSVVRS